MNAQLWMPIQDCLACCLWAHIALFQGLESSTKEAWGAKEKEMNYPKLVSGTIYKQVLNPVGVGGGTPA